METYLRENVLGKVFSHIHSYSQPSVVQVIGWTKNAAKDTAKLRYVYVRYVALHVHSDNMYGGNATIDTSDIIVCDKPILKPGYTRMLLHLPSDERGSLSLTYQEEYYGLDEDPSKAKFSWCVY